MSTREDFEAWAISVQLSTTRCEGLGGYAFYETRKALESWQAATSRQEAKVKVLVDVLESIGVEDYITTAINEHIRDYGEGYRAERLARYRDEKRQYINAIAAAKEG